MRFVVYMHDPGQRAALCEKLQAWMSLSRAALPVVDAEQDPLQTPAILFWDLDGTRPLPPLPSNTEEWALFVCSADPQKAIGSYSFHPTDFLHLPIQMDALWQALLRCPNLWWRSLERLEILSGRVRVQLPYYNLIFVEGARRGSLLHTTSQSITTREPLYQLALRLPAQIFVRCQRSFIINLCHVRQISSSGVVLSDGSELPLSRSSRLEILELYHNFSQLRYGE